MTTLPELLGQGGSIPFWRSGRTVLKGEYVKSPLDLEIYKRVTADGAGAIDPADDITNYVGESYLRTATITNRPMLSGNPSVPNYYAQGVTRVAPTISAGTRGLIVSATGRGAMYFLGSCRQVSAAGSFRLEVLIDGRTVFDNSANPAANSWTLLGNAITGSMAGNTYPDVTAILDMAPVEFRRSLAIYATPTGASLGSNDVFAYAIRSRN